MHYLSVMLALMVMHIRMVGRTLIVLKMMMLLMLLLLVMKLLVCHGSWNSKMASC